MEKINPKDIAVIIPTFNEQNMIRQVVSKLLDLQFNVIVVDDASTDDTELRLSDLSIHYLKHTVNLGQGASLQTGFQYLSNIEFKYIATFDADGQHRPEDILLLVKKLIEKDLDIVFGSRFLNEKPVNIPIIRKGLVKLGTIVNFIVAGIFLSDAHNGLRVIKASSLKNIELTENRMAHATEILREVKRLRLKYGECGMKLSYSEYSLLKGQKNRMAFSILLDICLSQILR